MPAVAVSLSDRVVIASVALGAPFLLAAHVAAGLVGPITQSTVKALLRVTAPFAAPAPQVQAEPAEVAPVTPAKLSFEVATKQQGRRVDKQVLKDNKP